MAALAKFSLLALGTLSVIAQSMNGPGTPFVFHSASRSVRPIIGMTGAAYLGKAVHSDLLFASISPDQKSLILESSDGVSIKGAVGNIDTALWSADSTKAVLFSASRQQVQWIVNGEAGRVIDIPNSTRLLALRADGSVAIVAASERIYRVSPDQAPVQIAALTHPTAAAFHENTLFIADATARQILAFEHDGSQRVWLDQIDAPDALLIDHGVVYAASKRLRTVRAYSVDTTLPQAELNLDWEPSAFQLLSNQDFLLNPHASAGEPLSVLTTRGGLAEAFIPTGVTQ